MDSLDLFCRLCASKELQMVSIFDGNETGNRIIDKIRTNLQIPISKDDLLPNKVCIFCLESLNRFCDFVKNCQAAQIHLQKLLLDLKENDNCKVRQESEGVPIHEPIQSHSPLRELSVCIPRLPLSRSFIMRRLEHDEVNSLSEEIMIHAVIPDTGKCRQAASEMELDSVALENEVKEEIKEELPTEESSCFPIDYSRTDEATWKSENYDELLQTSVLDIPLEPCFPKQAVISDENCCSSSIIGQLSDNTTGSACTLKNIISNIFESQDVIVDDKDNMMNVTFSQPKHRLQSSAVEVQPSCTSITLNAMQVSNLFPSSRISEADLRKLGAEIFAKHLPEILQDAQFQLNYEDLKSIVNGARICQPEQIENKEVCAAKSSTVDADFCDRPVNLRSSNIERMGPWIQLPVRCTVELVDIKNEFKENKVDAPLNEPNQISTGTTGMTISTPPSAEVTKTPVVLLNPLDENLVASEPLQKVDTEANKNCTEDLMAPYKGKTSPSLLVTHEVVKNSGPASKKVAEQPGRFKCDFCDLRFRRKISYLKHLTERHKCQNPENEKNKRSRKIGKKQSTRGSLGMRIKKMRPTPTPVPAQCEFCDATFSQPDLLKVHVEQHSSSRPYLCTVCEMNFVSRFQLSLHKSQKHIEKTLKCAFCSYAAANQYRLTQHTKEVHYKRFECDYCGKRLGKKSKLVGHIMKDHTECPPIKCYHCNLTFTQRYKYKEHLRINSLDSRFPCIRCGIEFDKQYKLSIHVSKIHERKKIQCPQCSFTTLHKYHLTQHKREVHKKSFECDICGKLESKKCRILVHIRNKHTTKKTYRCKFCNATYHSKNWYAEHLKKHLVSTG